MNRTLSILLIVCCVATVALSGAVGGSSFNISVSESVETPERTISHEIIGEHTVSSVGIAEPDSSMGVTVTAPAEETHFLDLYKDDVRIKSVRISDGDETLSIDTTDLESGSYMLRLQSDGNTEDVYPVVINGYDIAVDTTESTTDEEVSVNATVTPTARSEQPESVEAVVWDDDTNDRTTLTHDGEEQYTGTLSLAAFDEDYNVYVAALSDETIYDGQNEILAIDDSLTEETIADDGDDTESTEDDHSSSSGGDDSDATGGTGESSDSGDNLEDDTDSDDDGEDETPTDSTNETDDNETDPADQEDDSGVIQPNVDNSSTNETVDESGANGQNDGQTDDETPLSPVVAVVALLSSAALAIRRVAC